MRGCPCCRNEEQRNLWFRFVSYAYIRLSASFANLLSNLVHFQGGGVLRSEKC